MFAAPAEGTLKDFMEFGDTGCADHEQSPPHQRTHAAEHYALQGAERQAVIPAEFGRSRSGRLEFNTLETRLLS